MAEMNKELLIHLAKLARLELTDAESTKFVADLDNILEHFKELESLDTTNIVPMTGGTMLHNIFREDNSGPDNETERKRIVEAFPEKVRGYLKTPPVFE